MESGCLHGSLLVDSDDFLATMKNNGEAIEEIVEDATRRIKCMLILDGFCTYLIGKEEPVPARMTKTLIRLIETTPQFSRKNGWTVALLYQALHKKVWFTFKRTLGDTDVIHREVLGMTLKSYKKIQLQLEK